MENKICEILEAYEAGVVNREQALAWFDKLIAEAQGTTDKWFAREHHKNFERYNSK